MANDSVYADLLTSLSPLDKAGIDPDDARMDRAGAMRKLLGEAPPQNWWEQAQNDVPARPGMSPNGNALPPGMNSRGAPQVDAPDAAPTSAIPAGVTPSGDSTKPVAPSWEDLQRQNVASGMKSLDQSDQNLQTMQAQPDLASETKNLEAMRQNQAKPINPNDPEYKPNFATRLMRGVAGLAAGGVLGVVDPGAAGATPYGAPNKQYGIDTQQQAGRVASLDQQLKQTADNWKAKSDRAKAQAVEERANATSRGQLSTEITNQEKIPIEQQNADSEKARSFNDSPEGKAEAAKQLNATVLADRQSQMADSKNPLSKASTSDKAFFMATGKLPDPDRYHAPAEQLLFQRAIEAQAQGKPKGWKPSLDDIQKAVAASKGESGGTSMMVPDGKGGMTMTTVKPGDSVPSGATTVAGMASAQKSGTKEQQAAQQVVDDAETAHKLAAEAEAGNAPADVDLTLQLFKTMKGSAGAGIRYTNTENGLIMGARNSAQDLIAVGQKVLGSGQPLTTEQRNKMLRVIDIHAEQAKKHVQGGAPAATGDFNWNDHPVVQ